MSKIRLRCPSCGRVFLAAGEEKANSPCPACGATLGREATSPARKIAQRQRAAPRKAVAAPAPQPVSPAASAPEAASELVCPRCGLHFAPRAAHRETPASERHTVLVVEDMDYFRDIARDALEPRYRVEAAGTVQEAQAALIAGEIDLILLDLTLSNGEDGLKLLRALPFKPCPILIFTAEDASAMDGNTWDELQRLGADDVVIKGMNVGESILRKVGSLLGDDNDIEGTNP